MKRSWKDLPDYHSEVFSVQKSAIEKYARNDSLILNVGSGTGGGITFVQHDAKRVIHMDIDRESLKSIKTDSRNFALCADLRYLPFREGVFDFVLCDWVAEHLERPADALGQICAALKKGGKLQILTPNILSLFCLISLITPYRLKIIIRRRAFSQDFEKPHPVFYRLNRLSKIDSLLSRYGFRPLFSKRLGGMFIYFRKGSFFYWLAVLYEKLTSLFFLKWSKMYLYLIYQKNQ